MTRLETSAERISGTWATARAGPHSVALFTVPAAPAVPPRLPVLMLHGFPDEPGSLLAVAARLAAAGHLCVLPALPGYGASAALPEHTPRALALHFLSLMDTLGHDRFHVFGHDWGAVIAYALAEHGSSKVARLVALSVPPVQVLLQNLGRNPAQLVRSRYMLQFQVPGLGEALLRRDDLAMVEALWRRWSPGFEPPPERVAAVKAALGGPGTATHALSYYRTLLRPAALRDAAAAPRVGVPTLMLVGSGDACIAPALFERAESAFEAPFELKIIEGAGHFLPVEAPEPCAEAARAHFDGEKPTTAERGEGKPPVR